MARFERKAGTPTRSAQRRRLLADTKKIKKRQAKGECLDWPTCNYPGCAEPRVTEDCCYGHTLSGSSDAFLPNDGIIDWQAIEIARHGLRVVALTRVEFEIAVAWLLLDGHTHEEIFERTGVTFSTGPERMSKIREVMDVLRVAA